MTRYAALLALPLALAGCNGGGPSVSGSVDEGARSSSGLSSLWERVRGLTVEETKTVDMPALALMADAFQANLMGERLQPVAGRILMAREDDGTILTLDRQSAHQEGVFSEDFSTVPADVRAAAGSPAHLAYELPILVALTARKGWEVNAVRPDPAFDTPFFRANRHGPEYDADLHRRYMEMLAASAIYSNDVFAVISRQLGGVRLTDPDAAQARVLAAYHAIPPEQLRAMLGAAVTKVTQGRFTTDLTGSGNVHFTHSSAGDFVADARGTTWTRAGGVWFGDGRVNGQSVNFKLASTASQSQRQAQSGTQGTEADAKVGGTANVGPAR